MKLAIALVCAVLTSHVAAAEISHCGDTDVTVAIAASMDSWLAQQITAAGWSGPLPGSFDVSISSPSSTDQSQYQEECQATATIGFLGPDDDHDNERFSDSFEVIYTVADPDGWYGPKTAIDESTLLDGEAVERALMLVRGE
jgi:hypothetical protein